MQKKRVHHIHSSLVIGGDGGARIKAGKRGFILLFLVVESCGRKGGEKKGERRAHGSSTCFRGFGGASPRRTPAERLGQNLMLLQCSTYCTVYFTRTYVQYVGLNTAVLFLQNNTVRFSTVHTVHHSVSYRKGEFDVSQ